ncbi:MAG: sigma-70 family RNA polymerase sigma factor [Deltaproteobacteria bacterium]|nr:sigma-70 family RNA polymerase sigma factor [Deltaproteobacteria bacterium]
MEHAFEAACSGDPKALRALFDQYQRRVMGYCLLSTHGDREQAMDLTQDTFTRAFKSLHRLGDPARFGGWLFAIAANVCRSHGAAEQRRRQVMELFGLELQAEAPDDKSAREQRIEAVQRVLAAIEDPTLRQIVTLKYCEPEHTTRQIAEQLGIPHGTVTVKLMRFRAAVRRELACELLDAEEV